jgi:prepilin-type N-terminal cleavage/methylation domain-containing protein/prepilin-type processing-associated H-X9-DG protein
MSRRAFTLVELLVVIAIIGVLVALLLPAVQAAREAARRSQCGNNLKQMGLGLQNYHDTFNNLPIGARARGTNGAATAIGPSWLVSILPFCEQKNLYELLDVRERVNGEGYNVANMQLQAKNAKIGYLVCPSTSLPTQDTYNNHLLVVPSYVGITGAIGVEGAAGAPATYWPDELAARNKPASAGAGRISGGGLLLPNQSLNMAAAADGTSNTIIVGETSDWFWQAGTTRQRIDGSANCGWLCGTNTNLTTAGAITASHHFYNLTSIRHPVGANGKPSGNPAYNALGIHTNKGANNPLLSGHPNGAMVCFLDGHVQLLPRQIQMYILKRLATRDDGLAIPEF